MYTDKAIRPGAKGPIRTPLIRFAIVGNPRTGSSHLVSMLDSHPDIACWDCELFDQGEEFERSGYASPRDFLCERVFQVNAWAVGFKLLYDAMVRTPGIWDVLKDLGIRLVHCYRANYLDGYLSLQMATVNNAFTCFYGDYTIERVTLDPEDCREWMELAQSIDQDLPRKALTLGLPILSIEYKDLCADQASVLDFLEVVRRPMNSRLQKQRNGRQAELIVNYEALKRQFTGTRWARHFED
jgi:hypothetical protein